MCAFSLTVWQAAVATARAILILPAQPAMILTSI